MAQLIYVLKVRKISHREQYLFNACANELLFEDQYKFKEWISVEHSVLYH